MPIVQKMLAVVHHKPVHGGLGLCIAYARLNVWIKACKSTNKLRQNFSGIDETGEARNHHAPVNGQCSATTTQKGKHLWTIIDYACKIRIASIAQSKAGDSLDPCARKQWSFFLHSCHPQYLFCLATMSRQETFRRFKLKMFKKQRHVSCLAPTNA